ncbi:hypothetical protein [Aquimarina rhabdastrellae]
MVTREYNDEQKIIQLLNQKGIKDWSTVLKYIKNLPYGRNSNRYDLSLVLSQEKGTCSSKHALLKQIATLWKQEDVALILGMFKMNANNTPKIKSVLETYKLTYIPEAHCYLKINGKSIDSTTKQSDFTAIENDIIQEIEIQPDQVNTFKVTYHQAF